MSQGPAEAASPAASSYEDWRGWVAAGCAILLAVVFLAAGIWKLSDPLATEARMTQVLIPKLFALPVALLVGIGNTWIGVLLLVPRWRRWGAWLAALALTVYIAYFAIFYTRLRGEDCSCFPWVQRMVGPVFFVTDGLMLVAAVTAAIWSARSTSLKQAGMALAVIVVMALAVLGATMTQRGGILAPAQIQVDGKPFSLHEGRVLLFFFDPECSHCFQSARELGKLEWNGVRVVVAPTANPQWALAFLRDAGLRAGVTFEVAKLRETFRFTTDPPYAVALENGRARASFNFAEGEDVTGELRKLGWLR